MARRIYKAYCELLASKRWKEPAGAGAAPMAYVLWTNWLKHKPHNPRWPDHDRFVLSAGHRSALLYSLLHLSGYELSLIDIQLFRQWGRNADTAMFYAKARGRGNYPFFRADMNRRAVCPLSVDG